MYRCAVPRQGLNRTVIVNAAQALVERDGVDALTMRRLGAQLKVEAPSLYKHVPNKEAVLDGIADNVYAMVEFPSDDLDWLQQIEFVTRSFYNALIAHPNLVSIVAVRPVTGESTLAIAELAMQRMVGIGLTTEQSFQILDMMVGFVVGTALIVVNRPGPQPVADEAGTFPLVAGTLEQQGHSETFEFGLRTLIDGLNARFG